MYCAIVLYHTVMPYCQHRSQVGYPIYRSAAFSYTSILAATNSIHCSLPFALSLAAIFCLSDVFMNLVTLTLLRSSTT